MGKLRRPRALSGTLLPSGLADEGRGGRGGERLPLSESARGQLGYSHTFH